MNSVRKLYRCPQLARCASPLGTLVFVNRKQRSRVSGPFLDRVGARGKAIGLGSTAWRIKCLGDYLWKNFIFFYP